MKDMNQWSGMAAYILLIATLGLGAFDAHKRKKGGLSWFFTTMDIVVVLAFLSFLGKDLSLHFPYG